MLGTASRGDPAVFSLLPPLAVPLLLEPLTAAAAVAALHSAADALAVDLAGWAARDPGNLSREALEARQGALKTIDATIGELGRLRRELAPGVHRARGRHS